MNCILIDDEPLAREILEDYINEVPDLHLIASCRSGTEAMNYIYHHDLDLIFLDIQMPQLDGLQFIETLKPQMPVILTTAYQEYALKGYELNVTDYLLKPIRFDRFLKAVNKVKHNHTKLEARAKDQERKDFVFVKSEYKIHRVDVHSIQYIEGLKDYLIIQMPDQKILSLMSFNAIEPFLPPSQFVRIHKSFIVAMRHITSVEKSLVNIGDRQIPIGRTYRPSFFEILNRYKVG